MRFSTRLVDNGLADHVPRNAASYERGWFRECAIIPHTYDADFAAHIEEYKPELLSDLQSNGTKFFLKRKFGRPNDTYEFTIRPLDGGRPSIDLFWMYTAENETWVGGTAGDGSKYKYTYPKTKTCAGDLLGHIFWVSCDPELVLKAEYGPEWYNDFPTNTFSWKSSQFNVKPNGKWTAEEMKEVYKVY
ncbi:hypothetical protein NECAME_03542 [Necator americanus]|uniref:Uncharacterized protein n=1 Tax=Necator americanus TaxID=51031 RepID=W2T3N8_NECAM|nr:hypothetical protein NECAME_03542 [Necator americanus]ETN76169.1 hypothetical protein NECAME_03542 [Necator americanus]